MPAHDVVAVAREPGNRSAKTARRLVVTWQHPADRNIEPVGFLDYDGQCYRFGYIRHALSVKDFRPLLGFRDLYRAYSSEDLFPLFAQRVMDPRRPDYQRYVERLGLPEEASPWEQITDRRDAARATRSNCFHSRQLMARHSPASSWSTAYATSLTSHWFSTGARLR